MTFAPPRPVATGVTLRSGRVALALLTVLVWLVGTATPASAASEAITLEARPLLGGHVRVGSWAGVVVTARNAGPAVTGELRLTSGEGARTSYGSAVDLPTDSVKEFALYAQPAIFRTTIDVALVSGGETLATASVPITSHDPYTPVIGVVAERPQGVVGDILSAARTETAPSAAVVALTPADLPGRIEGWSAIDRLVWQDIDSGQLSSEQLRALQTWLGAGGRLIVLGGTTGATTLTAFPDAILPFRPSSSIDVDPAALADLIGTPPADAAVLPALTGELTHGVALARADDRVVAAQVRVGQGTVTLIGFDPGVAWLRDTPGATGLWRRLVPNTADRAVNPLTLTDDAGIVAALTNNLPAVELPRLEQLFALLGGYIVLIGPVNYLVLRRLDRREWAWITMPLLVAVFSIGSWTLGRVLKGTDVIVNQVAIVRGASGTETGLAQVYVGVFSPTRRQYDVQVAGNPLLSNPISQQNQGPGTFEQPLDVLQGETAHLRAYAVGYGSVRGFRAEAAAAAPLVSSSLEYVDGRLRGEVRNDSDAPIEAAAVVFGSAVARLDTIGPGESRQIDLRVAGDSQFGLPLSERVFGSTGNLEDFQRTATRRAVIDQLSGYSKFEGGGGLGEAAPLFIGWQPRAPLDVRLSGEAEPQLVGDTVYVVPVAASFAGTAAFPSTLLRRIVLDSDAAESMVSVEGFQMSRGTLTVEFRPPAFDGRLRATSLSIFMSTGGGLLGAPSSTPISPLPDSAQPDQDDPVGEGKAVQLLPSVQLWDRSAQRWVEFPAFDEGGGDLLGANRAIADPGRYVDESGAFRIRLVNRGEGSFFQFSAGLEGTLE